MNNFVEILYMVIAGFGLGFIIVEAVKNIIEYFK